MRRRRKGCAYGAITAKAYQVLAALLYQFHNSKTGRCFPSYKRIAEHVGCCADTVAEAIKALEACGLLTWVNCLKRVQIEGPGLPARPAPAARAFTGQAIATALSIRAKSPRCGIPSRFVLRSKPRANRRFNRVSSDLIPAPVV